MPLTKADIKDATLLIKAGNHRAARRIFEGSNDPDTLALLAQFDARFPPEPRVVAKPVDELAEVRRLMAQKKFAAAETRLRASSHPDAERLLQRIEKLKSTPKPVAQPKLRRRRYSFWRTVSMRLSGFLSVFN